jgi:hypothetical protein
LVPLPLCAAQPLEKAMVLRHSDVMARRPNIQPRFNG